MSTVQATLGFGILLAFSGITIGQETSVEDLRAQGEAIYTQGIYCVTCHGVDGEGGVGPNLQYGPLPSVIQTKLQTVPQMSLVNATLEPEFEELLALSTYIHSLGDNQVTLDDIANWRTELEMLATLNVKKVAFPLYERDKKVLEIMPFQTVKDSWQRRSKEGPLKRDYQVRVLETYEPGETIFSPEPSGLYFYENTGTASHFTPVGAVHANTSQIIIGDVQTKKVIASNEMPLELRGSVHTTVLSPDGKYVYIVGPNAKEPAADNMAMILRTPATMLKVDAFTLQPVKQLAVGGRIHHAQLYQDKYILFDTFNTDPDGLDFFLFDPESDQILGGISTVDLGGSSYTVYTDNEFIYVLMQPGSDGGGLLGAMRAASGENTADLPYWVTKIDPTTWEVVAEYPYSGYRGDWITIDAKSEYLYVPAAGSSNVTKINNATGEIEWASAVGIGPYGATLNADESELWVSNKGEGAGFIGRTITIVDTQTGRPMETLFSAYQSDHVLLSPNGKEMWVTSNGEGRILVFDAETREQTNSIDMPGYGDPHGLVFVKYDSEGIGQVVRDQGGFHNGVNPAEGNPVSN
jgi:DNA-binding beta-propeller fold protein YncE/mono/diheme cytochrome c family protein